MAPPVLPPPNWLSFDCYGTLVDWEGGIRQAFRELANATADNEKELFTIWEKLQWEKIRGPYTPYSKILQASFCEAVEQLGIRSSSFAGEAFVNSLAGWEPFPDVNPALLCLAPRFKLAIISNTDRDLLGRTLRHFHVRFDALITAEDAKSYKPNAEIFRYALKRLACTPAEVVHVAFGADYDLAPAGLLGIRVVYLNRKQLPVPDLPLEAEIRTMTELVALWRDVRAHPS